MNNIVIQYLTHQVLTNKNSPTEMDRQIWKMETPHNLTTHNQKKNPEQRLTQEQQVNLENLKRIMNSEKTTLPSVRNID